MGTTIRPEISKKNRYWIDKHRYYELKHFCLQYPTWKKAHSSLDSMVRFAYDAAGSSRTNKIQRPVEDTVINNKFLYEVIIFYKEKQLWNKNLENCYLVR